MWRDDWESRHAYLGKHEVSESILALNLDVACLLGNFVSFFLVPHGFLVTCFE